MEVLVILLVVLAGLVALAVPILKGFDRLAGRGPKQVKDGVESATTSDSGARKPCPYCAEDIKPAASICRFCQQELSDNWPTGGRA